MIQYTHIVKKQNHMQGVTKMLKDELNAKKEQYRKLKEEEKQYLASSAVQQQIKKDAQRIWTQVKEIFRKMPLSEEYHLFVGYEDNRIAYYNSDFGTVYWADLQEPLNKRHIHKMFFSHSKLEYPKETMDELLKLAKSEGIECDHKAMDGHRFWVYHYLRGIKIWG